MKHKIKCPHCGAEAAELTFYTFEGKFQYVCSVCGFEAKPAKYEKVAERYYKKGIKIKAGELIFNGSTGRPHTL